MIVVTLKYVLQSDNLNSELKMSDGFIEDDLMVDNCFGSGLEEE